MILDRRRKPKTTQLLGQSPLSQNMELFGVKVVKEEVMENV